RRFFKSPWAVEEVWESVKEAGLCRKTSSGSKDITLATASKHVIAFAAEEADALSSKRIGTSHLLLGVLRAQDCAAAAILYQRGFHLATTREDLKETAHDDSLNEQFVREREEVPEDVE